MYRFSAANLKQKCVIMAITVQDMSKVAERLIEKVWRSGCKGY